MTTRFVAKKGLITATQWQVVSQPLDRGLIPFRYPMLSPHGAGGDYSVAGNYGNQALVAKTLTTRGVVDITADYGGPHTWGNNASMQAMTDAYNYLQTQTEAKKGKVLLRGGSMGGLTALVWAAANPTKVAAICIDLPVLDLEDIWWGNYGGYKADINAAYGGAYTAAMSATKSPLRMAQSGVYFDLGIPMLIHYGTTDALCLPVKTQEFISLVPSAIGVPVVGGHSDSTYLKIDRERQIDFMSAYFL